MQTLHGKRRTYEHQYFEKKRDDLPEKTHRGKIDLIYIDLIYIDIKKHRD